MAADLDLTRPVIVQQRHQFSFKATTTTVQSHESEWLIIYIGQSHVCLHVQCMNSQLRAWIVIDEVYCKNFTGMLDSEE